MRWEVDAAWGCIGSGLRHAQHSRHWHRAPTPCDSMSRAWLARTVHVYCHTYHAAFYSGRLSARAIQTSAPTPASIGIELFGDPHCRWEVDCDDSLPCEEVLDVVADAASRMTGARTERGQIWGVKLDGRSSLTPLEDCSSLCAASVSAGLRVCQPVRGVR